MISTPSMVLVPWAASAAITCENPPRRSGMLSSAASSLAGLQITTEWV